MNAEDVSRLTLISKINSLQDRVSQFANDKEKAFLVSAIDFVNRRGYLTHGQECWIESISEKYSDERISEENDWQKNWDSAKRATAIRVALYYKSTPYFANIVTKILFNEDNFYLSKRQWDKFCGNKYAKKIINLYDEQPAFQKGDCVEARATNKIGSLNANHIRSFSGVGFVIEVNSKPITRAAKGSRIYSVLFTGHTKPLFVHESDIKKRRKQK